MGSGIEEKLIAYDEARSPVIQLHLKGFRRHEITCSKDQFHTTRLVLLERYGDHAIDHVALALADFGHLDCNGARLSKTCRVMHEVRHLRAPNLILAGKAIDIGTGAADPTALHYRCPPPGPRHVLGQKHATISTTKD